DMKKSEIIGKHFLEFSPGMEVVRRLIRNQFIEDYSDPNDKRSKKVKITQAGKIELAKAKKEIAIANKIVSGPFTEVDKIGALGGIMALVQFHKPIWENDLGTDLAEILEKYT
ncbi:MAG: winged helix DNA-binding protein, partial [Bacteroidota bacterium]